MMIINKNAMTNLSKKLDIFLKKTNLNALQFVKLVPEIKYQTLKRMLEYQDNGTLPNINSINILASFFKCTTAELLDDSISIPVTAYTSLDYILDQTTNFKLLNVNISLSIYEKLWFKEFFIIKNNNIIPILLDIFKDKHNILVNNIQIAGLFVKLTKLEYDGLYIVNKEQKQIEIIEVINVSSKSATINEQGKLITIDLNNLDIIGKFINFIIISNQNKELFFAHE